MKRLVVIIGCSFLGIAVVAIVGLNRMREEPTAPAIAPSEAEDIELVYGPWQRKEAPLFSDAAQVSGSPTSSSSGKIHSRQKRQVPCERGEELDDYVDSLFRFASRLIRAMEPFNGLVPNVTVDLPEYNLLLFLHSGGASHAYTISRKKPAWVMCQNGSISLGLTIGFEELRVMYKFRVIQDWKLLFDGELEAQILHPKSQVQFTQTTPDEDSEEAVQQRVDALRVWSVGQIRIMLKGLGNLTQGLSMFLTGFLNRNIDTLMPQLRDLESQAIVYANDLLQNISIPFFSIV